MYAREKRDPDDTNAGLVCTYLIFEWVIGRNTRVDTNRTRQQYAPTWLRRKLSCVDEKKILKIDDGLLCGFQSHNNNNNIIILSCQIIIFGAADARRDHWRKSASWRDLSRQCVGGTRTDGTVDSCIKDRFSGAERLLLRSVTRIKSENLPEIPRRNGFFPDSRRPARVRFAGSSWRSRIFKRPVGRTRVPKTTNFFSVRRDQNFHRYTTLLESEMFGVFSSAESCKTNALCIYSFVTTL